MNRTTKILMPISVLIFLIIISGAGVGWKSDDGEVQALNRAEAVELSEAAEYLEALSILPPKKEVQAIDFTVESLVGDSESLSDYRGKVIFLNFWATWCGPCKAEVGEIDALHETLKDEDFMIMALSIQEQKKKVSKFMKSNDIDFPVYLDSDGAVAAMYAVNGIPTTYIIAPDGTIVGRAIGPRQWGGTESVELMRSLMN
jgi:peroxiredoxin